MLPVQRRVRRREDFSSTVRHGRRSGSPALVVHVANDGSTLPARAGFIVGRSVGGAVTRNQVRRRLRHLMATRLHALPAGAVVVTRAGAEAAGLSSEDLAIALDTMLDRSLHRLSPRPTAASVPPAC